MTIGVDVYDEGAPGVVSSEGAAVLAHSLFSETTSGFSYIHLVACAARYTVHLAERSEMCWPLLFDQVAYLLS